MKTKDTPRARFQRRRTLRLSADEDARLEKQAESAGISVSEYMRRRFFGGRPIVARTDEQAIRELRRLGGLLKHHFVAVRDGGGATAVSEMQNALRQIGRAIDRLGKEP
jgi:hypothetical protein